MDEEQIRAMSLLEPYLDRIYPRFDAALDLYNEYPAMARAEHDNRAAASSTWCHVHKEFQREFMDEPGFHFLEIRGLHLVNVHDQMIWRFKMVDENGRHRNAKTRQQKDFDNQQELPGLPPKALRLVLGYQPDIAMSAVERVIVRGASGAWASQIIEQDDACGWVDITPARLPLGQQGGAAKKLRS